LHGINQKIISIKSTSKYEDRQTHATTKKNDTSNDIEDCPKLHSKHTTINDNYLKNNMNLNYKQ